MKPSKRSECACRAGGVPVAASGSTAAAHRRISSSSSSSCIRAFQLVILIALVSVSSSASSSAAASESESISVVRRNSTTEPPSPQPSQDYDKEEDEEDYPDYAAEAKPKTASGGPVDILKEMIDRGKVQDASEALLRLQTSLETGVSRLFKEAFPLIIRAGLELNISSTCTAGYMRVYTGLRETKNWAFRSKLLNDWLCCWLTKSILSSGWRQREAAQRNPDRDAHRFGILRRVPGYQALRWGNRGPAPVREVLPAWSAWSDRIKPRLGTPTRGCLSGWCRLGLGDARVLEAQRSALLPIRSLRPIRMPRSGSSTLCQLLWVNQFWFSFKQLTKWFNESTSRGNFRFRSPGRPLPDGGGPQVCSWSHSDIDSVSFLTASNQSSTQCFTHLLITNCLT